MMGDGPRSPRVFAHPGGVLFLRLLLQLLEHLDQVPRDRVVLPIPQGPVHQLPVEAVRGPESPERIGQLGDPVHALLAEQYLEGVRAVALSCSRSRSVMPGDPTLSP